MSINSYKRNVERGVAGPEIGVCLPASLEQISPNHSYRSRIYTDYLEFVEFLGSLSQKQQRSREVLEEYETVIEDLLRPLGRQAIKNLVLGRITTERGLVSKLRQLHDSDYRVAVDIKYGSFNPEREVHTVGLIPVDRDHVTLVSTHVPKCLRGVITTRQLAERIAISKESDVKNHPIATANLIAFPHE